MRAVLLLLAIALGASARAEIAPRRIYAPFPQWSVAGETNLFQIGTGGVAVLWDSARANSYFYLPLGLTLTAADDFTLTFVFNVKSLELGTTPGKPYTFEIAAGLLNLSNALSPEFFRGSGIDAEHGPRNTMEVAYFPASGFISATVAPTIATAENEILFSDNHPLALQLAASYKVEMSFTGNDRTLRSLLWKGEGSGAELAFPREAVELKPLVLPSTYAGFNLDTIALINYNDGGQLPVQFSGSLRGIGVFSQVELIVYNRPELRLERTAGRLSLTFDTALGWRYAIESCGGDEIWKPSGSPIEGTGRAASVSIDPTKATIFFRVSAHRI